MNSKTNLGNASLLGLSLLASGCAGGGAPLAAAPTLTSASTLDVTVAAPQHYKVLVDNAHVRVIDEKMHALVAHCFGHRPVRAWAGRG